MSVLCEMSLRPAEHLPEMDGIGVDVGLKYFAVCSHYKDFENINKTACSKNNSSSVVAMNKINSEREVNSALKTGRSKYYVCKSCMLDSCIFGENTFACTAKLLLF